MKTTVLFLIALIVLFFPATSSAQWVQTNGPSNSNVSALVVSSNGAGGTNLFAGTLENGVFLSTDNGTSWTVVNSGLELYPYILSLAVSSNGAGGTNLFAGTDGEGVFLSTNNGTSWTAANIGITVTSVRALAISGTNLFAGTDRGVFLSTNNGTSWSPVNSGLTSINVSALVVNNTNLFAGTYNGSVFLSTNNGASWTAVNSGLPNRILSLAVSPNGAGGTNLFAGGDYTGIFLSTDNGTSWSLVNSGLTNKTITSFAVSPNGLGGANLFAGTYGGVFLSTDNGTNWTAFNTGMSNYSTINVFTISDTYLFAGTPTGVWKRALSDLIPNRPPIANAGPDQTVNVGTQVTLNGSASTDPDGDALTYTWKEGTTALGTGVQLAVTLPIGVHTITLTVDDNRGGTSSDTVVVTVTQPNRPPVTNAGADQTVNVGTQVTLNGSASYDPDGDALTYTWKEGTTALGTGVQIAVTLPVGVDTITLTVNDNRGGINSDTVVVTVIQPNRPPVANAGADQTVNVGTQVTLNGSGSSDPDGDTLKYLWKEGTIVLGTAPQLVVTTLPVGVDTITLTVNDNRGGINSDTVVVTVKKVNRSPIANAGADQTVDVCTQVTLDGSASSDPDGDTLKYLWKEGTTVLGTCVKIKLLLPIGIHTITLTVDDNKGGTNTDTVVISIMKPNRPPIAKAGPNQTINAGTQVVLDGSASSDPNGDVLTYIWKEGKTTLGTGAQLAVTLQIGVHKITLTVDDGRGGTSSDVVVITIVKPNSPPVANAGPDQTVNITKCTSAKVMLDGSASFDPDGDELDFTWTEGTKTIGHTVKPQITLSTGIHNIILTVEDEKGAASSDTVIVNVVDTTSPIIVVPNKPMVLWPPDHKYVTLNISKIVNSVTDKDKHSIPGDHVSIQSVSCDEPTEGTGDGHQNDDINICNKAQTVYLRAERQGGGNGRVYTINLAVQDASGNIGQVSYEVWVPQNQGDKNVINDGPAYTVLANSSLAKEVLELSLLNSGQPSEFKLYNNYPNPFNPSTEIRFAIQEDNFVSVKVYDLLGHEVATLVNGQLSSGSYSVHFDASRLSSGTYIYRLIAGSSVQTKRMLLMK